MRIQYEIRGFPSETGGYNVTAYTEGTLRVLVTGALFLHADGVLLVEFAVALHRWLGETATAPVDFYYASMDFEEEPILAFRYDASSDEFRLESVWSAAEVAPVKRRHVLVAVRQYLSNLSNELQRDHCVNLHELLERSTLDA